MNDPTLNPWSVEPYEPPSWYSVAGASKKLRALEKRGLPSFYNWRFITLTVDQQQFKSPEVAYHHIQENFRQFLRTLKAYLGKTSIRYIRKLELQENGWPHWHLLLEYKEKLDNEDLAEIWGYGFTYTERCLNRKVPYQFKYICKNLSELPHWFKNLQRPRVLVTSVNFFPKSETGSQPSSSSAGEEDTPSVPRKSETVGERIERWSKTLLCRFHGSPAHTLRIRETWDTFAFKIWKRFPEARAVRLKLMELTDFAYNKIIQETWLHKTDNRTDYTSTAFLSHLRLSGGTPAMMESLTRQGVT